MKQHKPSQPVNLPEAERRGNRRNRTTLPTGLSPTDRVLLANHLLRTKDDINPFYLDDSDD